MQSLRTCGTWGIVLTIMVGLGPARPAARADALYGITDLGTLSGQSSSVATSINNNGQVVGISYNSSDGKFASDLTGPADPPRFQQTGDGAQSFLYGNGQLSQISPTGGLAMFINNSGQVVGGSSPSINDSGQYVSGAGVGIDTGNFSIASQLVSGGVTTALPLSPYAINNGGEVAGAIEVRDGGGAEPHATIYQNGQLTDLSSTVGSGSAYNSQAIAMNQQGNLLITLWTPVAGSQSFLYHASNGSATNLTALPGGSGMVAAALNNSDQAVGNGFLYSNGSIQSLLSLLPPSSGWSNLNATGINDAGQIVGQGTFNGQQVGFLITPDGEAIPEPGTLAIWGLVATCLGLNFVRRRKPRID